MAVRYDWETIRAEFEAGATMGALSRRHGVNKAAISRRARKEGWTADLTDVVNRRADAVDPQKKAAAVEAAAARKAAVISEQREAWGGFKNEVRAALDVNDFDRLKCLKIASEALRNAQECERKAWGIQDKAETEVSGGLSITWEK